MIVQLEPEETTRNTGYHGDYYYLALRSKKWAIPKGDDGAPTCDVILCERINHESICDCYLTRVNRKDDCRSGIRYSTGVIVL